MSAALLLYSPVDFDQICTKIFDFQSSVQLFTLLILPFPYENELKYRKQNIATLYLKLK